MYDEKYVLDWTKITSGFKSYHKTGILVTLTVMIITIFGNNILFPDVYESSALVRVKTNVVDTNTESNRIIRERVVQEELLSRIVLEKVFTELNLNKSDDEKTLIQNIVESVTGHETKVRSVNMDMFIRDLRQEINIVEVDSNNGGGTNLFSVTMRGSNPKTVAKIVNTLVDKYVSERKFATQSDTEIAVNFLKDQVEESRQRLHVITQKLDTFRTQNAAYLVSETEIASALQSAKLQLAENQNIMVQNKALVQTLRETLIDASSAGSIEQNGIVLSPKERLLQLEAKLAVLQAKFLPSHPDVKNTVAEIKFAKQQISLHRVSNVDVNISSRSNPEVNRIRVDLTNAQTAAQSAEARIKSLTEEIKSLRDKSSKIPTINQTLSSMQSMKDRAESEYIRLKDRLTSEMVSIEALKGSAGSRFSVVDPATEATIPLIRSRLSLYAIGIIISILMGTGVCIGLGTVFPRDVSVNTLETNDYMFYISSAVVFTCVLIYIIIQFIQQIIVVV